MDPYPSSDFSTIMMILVCIVASAFFSAAETAITSLGALKIRHLMETNGKVVKQLNLWLQHPSRVLTTILVGNNIANILAAALATELATRHFDSLAVGIASGVITLLVLVFGEITPKSIARVNAQGFAIFSMSIINVLYRAFYPVIWVFSELANTIIHRLGSPQSLQPVITQEELEFLINVGEKTGVLEDTKTTMINRVFEFDETKAREIMTPRTDLVALEKDATFDEAVKMAIDSGHSRLPVYQESIDHIVGVIFAKDLLKNLADGRKPTVAQLMRKTIFIPESKPLMEAFKELQKSKNHLAVTIDEYGGTAGIVTLEDILEEIVGDIQDEFDKEEAQIVETGKDIFDVAGSVHISDFKEYFGLDESFEEEVEGEVDTIAGWMTQHLGDLPEQGQTLNHGPLTIEVSEVDRHRIERLRVTRRIMLPEAMELPG